MQGNIINQAGRNAGMAPEWFVRKWMQKQQPAEYFTVGDGSQQSMSVISFAGRTALDNEWQQYYERMILDNIRYSGERLPRSMRVPVRVIGLYKDLIGECDRVKKGLNNG